MTAQLSKFTKSHQTTLNGLIWRCVSYTSVKLFKNAIRKSYTKIDLRWITDLNVKSKIIKLIEESIEESFHDFGIGKCLKQDTKL